jgi:hypothetical protein
VDFSSHNQGTIPKSKKFIHPQSVVMKFEKALVSKLAEFDSQSISGPRPGEYNPIRWYPG